MFYKQCKLFIVTACPMDRNYSDVSIVCKSISRRLLLAIRHVDCVDRRTHPAGCF